MALVQVVLRAVDDMSRPVNKAGGSLSTLKSSLASAGIALGAITAAGFAAMKMWNTTVGAVTSYNKAILDSSKATGTSTQQMSRIVQVADDFGISMDEVTRALQLATKNGFAPSVENLAALADRLNAIKDPTVRAAEAAKLLGRNWAVLDPMLQVGGNRFRDMAGQVQSGLVVTKAAAAATEEYRLRVDALNDEIEALKMAGGNILVRIILQEVHSQEQAREAIDARVEAQKRLRASGEELNVASVSATAAQIRHNDALDRAERLTQGLAGEVSNLRNELDALPQAKMIGIRVSTQMDAQSQEVMRLLGAGIISVGQNWANVNVQAQATVGQFSSATLGAAVRAEQAQPAAQLRGGVQQASGGLLADIALVGEQGPEMIINGVVIPAGQTRRLMQLGLVPGKKFGIGGIGGPVETGGINQGYTADSYLRSLSYAAGAGYYTGTGGAVVTGGGSGGGFGTSGATGGGGPAISAAQASQIIAAVSSSVVMAAQGAAIGVGAQVPAAVAQQTKEQNQIMGDGMKQLVLEVRALKQEIARAVRDAVQTL